MNNSNGQGTITYGVTGNAAYRKFVVYFINNSLFYCSTLKSSFQMILNETTNIADVQLISKQVCTSWNGGRTVTGVINNTGTIGISAPNRNTGAWTAFHEGWRFSPQIQSNLVYDFIKCDSDLDGFETFNLAVVQNDLYVNNPTLLQFYATVSNAQNLTNQLPINFVNTNQNSQTIYGSVSGTTIIYTINLSMVNCAIDFDSDNVSSITEDLNNDTNLANDDTDADGIANFIDNDDDGDLVLTNLEYVFPKNVALLDTDGDGFLNYLDNDDGGDGILTINEDANGNHNPTDDDTDNNGVPDYLQNNALLNQDFYLKSTILIYSNPVAEFLNIDNRSKQLITFLSIYSSKGQLIRQHKASVNSISISDLQSGLYLIKIEINNNVLNYKFVKN